MSILKMKGNTIMKLPILALALFGHHINLADPLTFSQDRPLTTFENFYVSEIYQPTMNPSFLGQRIVETRQIRKSTRPKGICPAPSSNSKQSMPTQTLDTKKTIIITFINNTNTPASAHVFIDTLKDNIGYFGYALEAKSKRKLPMKELYWFPQAATGYKTTKRFHVLNHALPNKLTIVIPNQKNHTFDIEQGNYTVILNNGDNNEISVTFRKTIE